MGKGIKYGYTPYVDLTDHKGIYIFLINYLATIISEVNHLGLFVIHVLISYFTVITLYKISYLLTKKHLVSVATSLTIFAIQNTYFFSGGAIKCETFLAPFLYLSLYLFLKNDWNEKLSRNMIIIGASAGIGLLTKPNVALCFLPMAIYLTYIYIIKKEYGRIWWLLLSGLLGVAIGAFPGVIYTIKNDCFKEMIQYTFINNFKYTGSLYYTYNSIGEAVFTTLQYFAKWIMLSVISIYPFYKLVKSRMLNVFYILFLIFNMIASFMALRSFSHYANPLLLNILFLVMYTYLLIDEYVISKRKSFIYLYIALFALLFVYAYRFSWTTTKLKYQRYYYFAKEVREYFDRAAMENSNENNALAEKGQNGEGKQSKVLIIGATLNIYNELNVLPPIKNFCIPYIRNRDMVDAYDEIKESLKSKDSEYAILSFTGLMIRSGALQEIRALLKENYKLVFDSRGAEFYQRK